MEKRAFVLAISGDIFFWLACLAVFRWCGARLAGPHPLAEALVCSASMIVGRELFQTGIGFLLAGNRQDFSWKTFWCRMAYAFAVVHFFLGAIGLVGIVPLLAAAPFFLLLVAVHIWRPIRAGGAPAPGAPLVEPFRGLCAYYGLGYVGLQVLEASHNEIYSSLRPRAMVSVSQDADMLPRMEQRFLLAHELSHFARHHFQRKAFFEFAVVVAQTAMPFLASGLLFPRYWFAGHWMPPVQYPIPLMVMTLANAPFLALSRWFYFRLERQADLDAAAATQQPGVARRVLLWSSNGAAPDEDRGIVRRMEAFGRIHPPAAPGELVENSSYLCLTYRCNSGCTFCASDMTGGARDIPLESVRAFVEKDFGPRERLVLSGGEPLLHPRFGEVVDAIRGRYRKICLMTNGTLLPTRPDAVGFVREGVFGSIAIPLYGSSARSHDRLTRSRGSWARANEALGLVSGMPIRTELKLLWSAVTMRENTGILEMVRKGEIPRPDSVSLTQLIMGAKAYRRYDLFKMDVSRHLGLLNETVAGMADFNFTLKNIPLCWLTQDNLAMVLAREERPPVISRIRYLCPGKRRPVFVSQVPAERDECFFCHLKTRCSRFYPSQEGPVLADLPVRPIERIPAIDIP